MNMEHKASSAPVPQLATKPSAPKRDIQWADVELREYIN